MDKLDAAMKRICDFRDERDWKQFHPPKDLAISLTVEAAEVAEHFLWKTTDELNALSKECVEEIGDELADVLHNLLLIAHHYNIDMDEASKRKIARTAAKYPVEKCKGKSDKHTSYQ